MTTFSRRQFLGSAAASYFSLQGAMPAFFAQSALLAAQADQNDRVLVVIELNGGNDGLNTLVPFENDLYYQNRPVIGIPKNRVVHLTDQIGMPNDMAPLAEMFKQGKLAAIQGVGYPTPDRSHFRSMEIWHTASTETQAPPTGWLGRVLDHRYKPNDHRAQGIVLADFYMPQAFTAEKATVPQGQHLDAAPPGDLTPEQKLLRKLSTTAKPANDTLGYLRREAEVTFTIADQLKNRKRSFKPGGEYPAEIGKQLLRAAEVITADLGIRLLYASSGGFDTHATQLDFQPARLSELANALALFQKDMERVGLAHKVLVLIFSEFGRRVRENASKGTDHGAASCMFLTGTKVKGGLAGKYPALDDLDKGDLKYQVDFRSVYATVLQNWLGCPAEKLLGQDYPLLDLIRA